jgi:hypothetical protein
MRMDFGLSLLLMLAHLLEMTILAEDCFLRYTTQRIKSSTYLSRGSVIFCDEELAVLLYRNCSNQYSHSVDIFSLNM